jgi:general secretion pathway protein G
MEKGIRVIRNAGFTLIEVLVTVVVIGVLAAVVIPAVTSQVTAGDSARVLSDLNNVRTGIENFDIAVRAYPGDIDDLVNTVSTTNQDINGSNYLQTQRDAWSGPYIEATVPATLTNANRTTGSAFKTGYTASIDNRLVGCAITNVTTYCDSTGSTDYVTVHINNLSGAQSQSVNDLIDGSGESNSSTAGKFRYFAASSMGFYFAAPYVR